MVVAGNFRGGTDGIGVDLVREILAKTLCLWRLSAEMDWQNRVW